MRRKIAVLIVVMLVALACQDSGARPTAVLTAADSADQVINGFQHYMTNDGVRRSRVDADTAYFYEPTQMTDLRHVKVYFYDLKGEAGSTITAKRGKYRWQDGSMEAIGDVVVLSPDGRKLRTEMLRYDNATNTISTDQPFRFERGTEYIEGSSFRSDPDFRNVVTDRPHGSAGQGVLLPGQTGVDSTR